MGEAAFVISDADDGLRERLSQEISAFNVAATGLADGALLGIAVREDGGPCARGWPGGRGAAAVTSRRLAHWLGPRASGLVMPCQNSYTDYELVLPAIASCSPVLAD